MDLKTVKQLADLMEQYGLTSIEVEEGEHKVALSKQAAVQAPAVPVPAVAAQPAIASHSPTADAPGTAPASAPSAPEGEELKAPLVGVAYLAPKPGEKPFVAKGQKVKKGEVLCIVEAMKVMNEFAAPRDGVIAEICTEDGQLVEFGQCLFRLL